MGIGTAYKMGGYALTACGLSVASAAAYATDQPPLLRAPVISEPPAPELATLFQLKVRLPEGKGLARQLLDAGVNRDDAARAAQLAAGHLGDGLGGCDAKVEISRAVDGSGFKLERVTLLTQTGATVIERRQGELTIASQTGASRLRIV